MEMDSIETESFCSSNSSDILPKDYSLSSPMSVKSEINEISKSMKLSFGVDRLLSKCEKKFERKLNGENFTIANNEISSANDEQNISKIESNRLGINLLHQQLTNANNGFLHNNYLLKPFPLRFGRNENGELKSIKKLNKTQSEIE